MGLLKRIAQELKELSAHLLKAGYEFRAAELERLAAELEEYRLNYGDQSIGERGILTPDGTFTSS